MTTTLENDPVETGTPTDLDPKRFRALAVIAIAQLMVVLDASVVIIALPSAQRSLHISVANRQWMLTAYTLSFAGFLLLGGRIADYMGRKRMFIISLLGFAAASALGGLAQSSAMLFGARALQGAFAAIMAPSALSLLTVAFTEAKERARAFAVYGGIAGGGAAIGLIFGGFLTEYASWRWTLLINVPIAIVAAFAAWFVVTESRSQVRHGYDIPGAITVTGGLLALVYAFTKAGSDGWASSTTIIFFTLAAILLASLRAPGTAGRTPAPPTPDRARPQPGRVIPVLTSGRHGHAGHLPVTDLLLPRDPALFRHEERFRLRALLLGDHLRCDPGQSPAASVRTASGPHSRTALGAIGLVIFSFISVHSSYLSHVFPAEVIVSLGMGLAFVALSSTALIGVNDEDAGVASAMVNATQQTGSSLGAALINTIAASATAAYLATHGSSVKAQAVGAVHGYTTAFVFSAIILVVAAISAFALIRARGSTADEEKAALGGGTACLTAVMGLRMVPVSQESPQGGEEEKRLVEHGVVTSLGNLDHRGDPAQPFVHGGPDIGRHQSAL